MLSLKRSSKGVELHHTYMAWMHNSSLVDTEVKSITSLPTRNRDVNELDEAATSAYKRK